MLKDYYELKTELLKHNDETKVCEYLVRVVFCRKSLTVQAVKRIAKEIGIKNQGEPRCLTNSMTP